jgi:hypothetical protein
MELLGLKLLHEKNEIEKLKLEAKLKLQHKRLQIYSITSWPLKFKQEGILSQGKRNEQALNGCDYTKSKE